MNSFIKRSIKKEGLGQKLFLAREKRGISLKDASLFCKIPEKYLEALEQEKWNALPGDIYAKMFLKKYCNFLKVHCGMSLEEYKKRALNDSLRKKDESTKNKFILFFQNLTTNQIRKILFVFVLIILILYIYYETSRYTRAPELNILYPQKDYITTDNMVSIKGKTDPESTVYINEKNISIEESGEFSVDVKLKDGINQFKITSQRKHGRQHIENVVVFKKEN